MARKIWLTSTFKLFLKSVRRVCGVGHSKKSYSKVWIVCDLIFLSCFFFDCFLFFCFQKKKRDNWIANCLFHKRTKQQNNKTTKKQKPFLCQNKTTKRRHFFLFLFCCYCCYDNDSKLKCRRWFEKLLGWVLQLCSLRCFWSFSSVTIKSSSSLGLSKKKRMNMKNPSSKISINQSIQSTIRKPTENTLKKSFLFFWMKRGQFFWLFCDHFGFWIFVPKMCNFFLFFDLFCSFQKNNVCWIRQIWRLRRRHKTTTTTTYILSIIIQFCQSQFFFVVNNPQKEKCKSKNVFFATTKNDVWLFCRGNSFNQNWVKQSRTRFNLNNHCEIWSVPNTKSTIQTPLFHSSWCQELNKISFFEIFELVWTKNQKQQMQSIHIKKNWRKKRNWLTSNHKNNLSKWIFFVCCCCCCWLVVVVVVVVCCCLFVVVFSLVVCLT